MGKAFFNLAIGLVLIAPLAAQQTGQAAPPAQGQNQGGQGGRGRQNRDPSLQQAPGTAVVAGRVFAADTGRPVKRALVFVSSTGRGGRSIQTDDQGAYQITGLQAGSYTVTASKAGFVDGIYGQRRPLQPGTPIDVADAQAVPNIDIRLIRGGVIAGRVLDEDGEALARATVTVQRFQYVRGEKQLMAVGSAQTDDRGQYRLFGLPPGDYYVSGSVSESMGRGMTQLLAGGGFNGRGGRGGFGPVDAEPTGYAPTYYPGVASAADAGKVTVGPGQELTSIDFQVQLVPFATISGIVAGADSPGQVQMIPLDVGGVVMGGLALRGRSMPNGGFTVANVPPGRYLMVARSGGRWDEQKTAIQTINVNGQNITQMVLTLLPGVAISGNVTVESAGTPAPTDYSNIRIDVPEVDPLPVGAGPGGGGPNQTSGRAEKNGAFEVDNLLPGRHYIRVTAPAPWAVKSVSANGRDVSDVALELKAGQNIDNVTVVLTDRSTSLGGTVRDGMSNGIGNLTVIAFATDEQYWHAQSRLIQAARTTQTGAFQMKGLPPGDYYLVAVDEVQQGEWFDPAFLAGVRAAATRVSLNEGESKTQDLKAPSS